MYASYAEQEDKVEREWCVGLPAAIFAPWVQRIVENLEREDPLPPPSVRLGDVERGAWGSLVSTNLSLYQLGCECS